LTKEAKSQESFVSTITEMINPKSEIESRRLKILGSEEIRNIFGLPDFTMEERLEYFTLVASESKFLDELRSLTSKLYFILQAGYFKARRLFFNFELDEVVEDVEYVLQTHFPDRTVNFEDLRTVAKNTRLNGQQVLLRLYNYRWCGEAERRILEEKARAFARISSKPIYIFRELISFLQKERIILPGYSSLQDTIGQALIYEQNRLTDLLANSLSISEINKLDDLLEDTDSFYEITRLKREPKDFSLSEIRDEIERAHQIKEVYRFAQNLLPVLEVSNESVGYYASLVSYYSVYKLKRFDRRIARLYLLCFAFTRYRRVNDNLINCLIYRLRQYGDQTKEDVQTKLSGLRLETNQNIGKAGQVLRLFTDERIAPETPFGEVRQKAFDILSRQAMDQVAETFAGDARFDETELRWQYLEKIALRIKMNLRPILTAVDFGGLSTNPDLLEAIEFLRQAFLQDKTISQISSDKFPCGFILEKQNRYLYRKDENSKQKRIIPDRYEFLVYQLLRDGLEAGEMHCRDSLRFRSFEDDLLTDEHWQNKESLINDAGLPILKTSILAHLKSLEELLERRLEQVNGRILSEENKYFIFKGQDKNNRWTLEYPGKPDEINHSVFDSVPQNDIGNVLSFVHRNTGFIDSFEHLLGKYVKSSVDEQVINACLIAWGTNIGLGKMGSISDISAETLRMASENFIRPETLHSANDSITNAIAEFPLFRHYDINEVVHSSSDGQKFETKFQTINARYSPKYFGLKKGIVSYTLVANHIPINARIIGANEHESHFVFDLLFNNTTSVQPEIHSTDTHGTNQVNFALLHLFGFQFAPRYKDIYDTVEKSLYGFQHPSRYPDLPLKPIRKINTRLIISEWDNITRIILSLAFKATTQHIITSKLSSYARKNSTKRAIWEYDNIIKSLYLLDYIDSPPLRRNVTQALNRGENYHQLRRSIAHANFGKLRFKSENEQQIWNECSRLLTNCILYYNISILTNLIKRKEQSGMGDEIVYLKQISPVAWQHINFLGRYEFGKSATPINIDEIVDRLNQRRVGIKELSAY
jgi:TnpA family transposase